MKHQLHEVWKEKDGWKLQAPNGILTFDTKRAAQNFASVVSKNFKKIKLHFTLDNRLVALKEIRKAKSKFISATIYIKNQEVDFVTSSFDYLWDYCTSYYNFYVNLTVRA